MHKHHSFINMTSYKEEHETFIAGHEGTTYLEVAMLSSIACISCFLRDLCILYDLRKVIRSKLLIDVILLVLPNIFGMTVLSSYVGLFHFTLLFISIALYFHIQKTAGQDHRTALFHKVNLNDKKAFITYFRSVVNLCTAVAILAVDFPAFPRRLAKSETYGFGGMDAGVGLFVVANAIVSNEARGKSSLLPIWHQLKKAVISSIPLLVLGCIRLLTVKGMDYHEHVTEYGVHWNFFFTMAILKILLTVIYYVLPVRCSAVGACAVVIAHQIFLSNGLSSYIINGLDGIKGRSGYIDANREGIYSLPGYIAIYMFGVEIGSSYFQPRKNLKDWLMVSRSLALKFTAFTSVMMFFHWVVEPVSRRFANAAFSFWVLSLSSLMILECLLADIFITYLRADNSAVTLNSEIETIGNVHKLVYNNQKLAQRGTNLTNSSSADGGGDTFKSVRSKVKNELHLKSEVCLLDAISFNSLLFFLLANLLTGVVNMSFATIHASDLKAVSTLVLYMSTLSSVVVALQKMNICTKLW